MTYTQVILLREAAIGGSINNGLFFWLEYGIHLYLFCCNPFTYVPGGIGFFSYNEVVRERMRVLNG